jgi:hypothetical protein
MTPHSIQLSDEERRILSAILDGALQRTDFALMEMHPTHPLRDVCAVERRVIVELLRKLGEAE